MRCFIFDAKISYFGYRVMTQGQCIQKDVLLITLRRHESKTHISLQSVQADPSKLYIVDY